MTRHPIKRAIKRAIDIVVSATLLVALSPFLLLMAGLIWWQLGRPTLFRQHRIGLRERPFHIIKFRTMTREKDEHGRLLPDEERMHPFGCWIRSWSLDELPQLWNILCGRMSLVGPRPLVKEDLPYQRPDERIRHNMRPGVTGLAQVSGRNAVHWDDRFKLDRYYVENWNLWLDCTILLRTIPIVLKREGIQAEGHSTMPRLHVCRAGMNVIDSPYAANAKPLHAESSDKAYAV